MLLKGNSKMFLLLFILLSVEASSQDYFLKVDKVNPILYLIREDSNVALDSIKHASSFSGFTFGLNENKVFTISEAIGSNHRSLFYLNYYEIRNNKFFPVGYVSIPEDDKKVHAGLTIKIKDSVLLLNYSFADKQISRIYILNAELVNNFKTNYDLFRKEVIQTEGILLERKVPSRL